MSLIAQQLMAASLHAKRLAAEDAEQTTRQRKRVQRAARTRKAKGNGKYIGTGLKAALVQRLPVGIGNAAAIADVRQLLTDIAFADHGLSSTLSSLVDAGDIKRIGTPKKYRYYKESA